MPRLAASLANQAPASLGEAITGVDAQNVRLLVRAVLHASGRRQFPAGVIFVIALLAAAAMSAAVTTADIAADAGDRVRLAYAFRVVPEKAKTASHSTTPLAHGPWLSLHPLIC
jgi:hypothetical protein